MRGKGAEGVRGEKVNDGRGTEKEHRWMEEHANGFHDKMSTRRQWRNGNVGRKADNAKWSLGKTLETEMRLIANDGCSKRALKVGRERLLVRSYVRASVGRRRNVEGVKWPHE
ncbi:hypothetical protein R1flu_001668 [Riccia fluitans]|uniref:Uncharacterized protein n=1 Tax=Riccia fluitans TaxID=41844 RepID=A0ABD1Y3X3_9MARC